MSGAIDLAALAQSLEALLAAAGEPLSLDRLTALVEPDHGAGRGDVRRALEALAVRYEASASEVVEVASGWRLQVRARHAGLLARLWEERPPKLSRAVLETLAIIVYRQPLARSDIEAIRGVSVSSQIMKTLDGYDWIKVVGHRDVPGRPALYATTARFLDDFGLARLSDLPPLAEVKDAEALDVALARLADTEGDSAETAGTDSDSGLA